MTLDYSSHPSELVAGGAVQGEKKDVTVDDLKKAIPAHCFRPSYVTSVFYLLRDLLVVATLGWTAWTYIPHIPNTVPRYIAWLLYGWIQGLAFTGLWVLGHECGHGGFSPSQRFNDTVGFALHSALLTPYFSWKSTHRRHHIYANNLAKDHNYVPPQWNEYAAGFMLSAKGREKLDEMTQDAPVVVLLRIIMQQILGWPWYMFDNITASPGSLYRKKSNTLLGNSHFLPSSTLFRPEESHLIFASDLGIGFIIFTLFVASQKYGFPTVALLYIQPYIWVNHWIVAITYLHHTHPKIPKYQPEAWNFMKGALATVDRDFGWIGKHMLHNIIEYHVIHHLFSRIPQYHAEEATNAIIPLLGSAYHSEKNRNNSNNNSWFLFALYESFTECQWIEPDDAADPKDRSYWFKAGPCPPPGAGWAGVAGPEKISANKHA